MTRKSGSSGDTPTIDGQAAAAGSGLDISMDLDDPDLDAAIEQALAATEKRAKASARRRHAMPELPSFDLADLGDDPEQSMHIFVDETEGAEDGFDFMGGGSRKDEDEDDDLSHEADGTDDEFEFLSLEGKPASRAAGDTGPSERGFDELDRELKQALDDEDEADEGDLQAEMEKLLAESFGVGDASDSDGDLGFPDFDDEADAQILAEDNSLDSGDGEVFAAGDDGTAAMPMELREENEALRAQVIELSRALSLRDLELRTAEDRVDTLEQQVIAAARQSAGVSREFEAFRRRMERDKEELHKFAGEKTIKEFLGVFDNLERALAHAGEERAGPLGEGVEMTLGQFMAALRRCGAERVTADPGTEFDPQFHEAVGQEPSDTVDAGLISQQMQAGFTLHTRLLRASMVTVSSGPLEPVPKPPKTKAKAKRKRKTPRRKADAAAAEGGDDLSLDGSEPEALAAAADVAGESTAAVTDEDTDAVTDETANVSAEETPDASPDETTEAPDDDIEGSPDEDTTTPPGARQPASKRRRSRSRKGSSSEEAKVDEPTGEPAGGGTEPDRD